MRSLVNCLCGLIYFTLAVWIIVIDNRENESIEKLHGLIPKDAQDAGIIENIKDADFKIKQMRAS